MSDNTPNTSIKERDITFYFCVLCVILFFLDLITGFKLTLLGCKDNTLILQNFEFYRLLTCNLLHRNFLHIISNILLIIYAGSTVETFYKKSHYILLLTVLGTFSYLYSLAFTTGNSVGASGIAFGLTGCLIALSSHTTHPTKYRITCSIITLFSFVSGFLSNNTDNAAHIGGLIAGILLGYASFIHNKLIALLISCAALVPVFTIIIKFYNGCY